jgi:hypothetical protein
MQGKYAIWSGALALGMFSTACADDRSSLERGDVELQWALGPRGCEQAGVSEVFVTTDVMAAGVSTTGWRFDCEARQGVIRDLAPGNYTFQIEAFAEGGMLWYEGSTGRVQVRPGGLTVGAPVVMEATPASYSVKWTFGGPLCRHVDVDRVSVLVFDLRGTVETMAEAECDEGLVRMTLPPGEYDVVVQALSVEDVLRFEQVVSVSLDRGEVLTDEIELSDSANEVDDGALDELGAD